MKPGSSLLRLALRVAIGTTVAFFTIVFIIATLVALGRPHKNNSITPEQQRQLVDGITKVQEHYWQLERQIREAEIRLDSYGPGQADLKAGTLQGISTLRRERAKWKREMEKLRGQAASANNGRLPDWWPTEHAIP